MKSSRDSPEQVAFGLRQAEEGTPMSEVCRKMGSASSPSTAGRRGSKGWVWLRCAGSRFWRRKTASSGSWWTTSAWTSRCSRTCCGKSPEACSAAAPGRVPAGSLRRVGAPGLPGVDPAQGQPPLPERGR